ncbi:MAG: GNAT family N-acetyltransferase [Methylobacteriaceae bacterium]|nr:GNAT family N-acetyltransferase [Methylobacteriaceae bacterium]MBV9702434.1 GNAT family N-acetyltransferase [Methylobacteriaceae bacterium]
MTPQDGFSVERLERAFPVELNALIAEALAEGDDFMSGLAEHARTADDLDAEEGRFVGWAADRLAGVASITADPYVTDGLTGRLRWIYVRPVFRGRGLGERLVRACLDYGSGRWQRIRLHTENPIAERIYLRFGFVALGGTSPRATHERSSGQAQRDGNG